MLRITSGALVTSTARPVVLRVTKARAAVGVRVTPKRVTTSRRAKVAITVRAKGVNARGTALVKVGTRSFAVRVNANGKGSVRLPRLSRGTKKVTVRYLGNANLTSAKKVVRIQVRR